ncbi:MAG TPA: ATP-binding protein [Prosthecochloris aestuarii]|uniref:ATP-binding protein n=1 Tax=Prosthecochloris aestuarii TaxID=1102 RepID=A0A831WNF7_PROAE|nr:ATP-binding protein [Prosthecochloris aestuarii]
MSLSWPQRNTTPLLELVEQGETRHTEFKRLVHSPQKIAKSIAAFANTEGGVILIGVDDDKRITGIHSEKEMLEIIDEAVRFHVEPRVKPETAVEEFKKRLVLLVFIPESRQKPHYHISTERDRETLKQVIRRRVYTREGSHNKAASDDKICLMRSQSSPIHLSFGRNEQLLFSHLQQHGTITTKEFCSLTGLSRNKAMQTLVSMVRTGTLVLQGTGNKSYFALP